MKPTEMEGSVFRAIAKGLGVYQGILCLADVVYVVIARADLRLGDPMGSNWRYVVWAVFHFCVAAVLVLGTDSLCRIAFPAPGREPGQAP